MRLSGKCLILAFLACSTGQVASQEMESAWDVFVASSQKTYWDASADALEAEIRYRELAQALSNNEVSTSAAPSEVDIPGIIEALKEHGFTPSSGAIAAQEKTVAFSFDWTVLQVGRSAAGTPYVELTNGHEIRRASSGEIVEGWKINVDSTGKATARKGSVTKTL